MDSRVYFHQYRRPRYSNPTYISSNVTNSLSFYQDKPFHTQRSNDIVNPYQQSFRGSQVNQRVNSYSLNKPLDSGMRQRYNTINPATNNEQQNNEQYRRGNSNGRNYSNLSSYGSNSLNLNQSDIYNKQNSKYNIITMKPKEFDISIKQHPKYTLQNKDQLYYKRMAQQLQKKKLYDQIYINKKNANTIYPQSIAGKYTYQMDKQRPSHNNSSSNGRHHTNQNNNNLNPETNNQSYQMPHIPLGNHKPPKSFTPKLLNHMDQLISLS